MKETKNKPMATVELLNEYNGIINQLKNTELSDDEIIRLGNITVEIENKYDWFDYAYKENGHYGIRDVFGKVIVPPIFDDYVEFYHYLHQLSVIPMVKGTQTVLVKTDGTGTIIPDTAYDTIHYVESAPFFQMYRGGKFGFMASDGTILVPPILTSTSPFCNGMAPIEANGKWGVMSTEGYCLMPQFDEVGDLELDEPVRVRIGDQWGFVDENDHFTLDEDDAAWYACIPSE